MMARPTEGYVYVPGEDSGPMSKASVGARIRNLTDRPPWIVVDHSIASIIVARWPGKLWRVTEIDADGIEQVSQDANYTRAKAVTVCGEVSTSFLFGKHGDSVCLVIDRASQLDVPQVQALASSRHIHAGEVYSRAWHRWLTERNPRGEYEKGDWTGALDIAEPIDRSPVNSGFSVLHRVIWERAEALVGPAAFLEDQDEERYLVPTWDSAANAMLEAAMALGAPELSELGDQFILLQAWRAVFGVTDSKRQ